MNDNMMQYAAGFLVSYLLEGQARVSLWSVDPPIQVKPRPGQAPPGARSLGFYLEGEGDHLRLGNVVIDLRDPQCHALRRLLARAGYRDEWTPEELLANRFIQAQVRWLRGEGLSGHEFPG